MKFTPMSNSLVVDMENVTEEKTESGIILTNPVQKGPSRGTVVKTGPGIMLPDGKLGEMIIKEGDVVYFDRYSAKAIDIEGKEYILIREDQLFGYTRD